MVCVCGESCRAINRKPVSLTNEFPLKYSKYQHQRAAISPDYLDSLTHAYVTMQAIILRTLKISMVSLKTGLASLTYYNNQLFITSSMLSGHISLMYLLLKR